MKFPKYKQNLSIVRNNTGKYIKSYDTLVAKIEGDELIQLGWWSVTTQKHINYAAHYLGLTLIKDYEHVDPEEIYDIKYED